MKRWSDLSDAQQKQAIDKAKTQIVEAILEGGLKFNDAVNGDDLQARIDAAFEKAEAMQTPWFAHEYLYDDDVVAEAIEGMARCDAEDAFYLERGESVLRVDA